MDTTTGAQPAAETPAAQAPDSGSFSLAEYRSKRAGVAPTEERKTVEAQPDETSVDPEVDSDPELASEIDKIEAPVKDETPQQKAARTRKNKEAAKLAYKTRLQNERTRLREENEALRQRLNAPVGRERQPAAPHANRPPAEAAPAADPSDPEPTFDQWALKHPFNAFAEKHPNHPDPYAGWQAEFSKDWNRWDRRQEGRKEQAARAEQDRQRHESHIDARTNAVDDEGERQFKDYGAVLAPLVQMARGTPAGKVITEALAEIEDPKVAAKVAYQLGKELDALKAQRSLGALHQFIGRITERVLSAAEKPKPAAPHVSAAPAPHTPVAAASTGVPANPAAKGGTDISLAEKRRWDAAHGRRSA